MVSSFSPVTVAAAFAVSSTIFNCIVLCLLFDVDVKAHAVSDRHVASPVIDDGVLETKAEAEEAAATRRSRVDRVMMAECVDGK